LFNELDSSNKGYLTPTDLELYFGQDNDLRGIDYREILQHWSNTSREEDRLSFEDLNKALKLNIDS